VIPEKRLQKCTTRLWVNKTKEKVREWNRPNLEQSILELQSLQGQQQKPDQAPTGQQPHPPTVYQLQVQEEVVQHIQLEQTQQHLPPPPHDPWFHQAPCRRTNQPAHAKLESEFHPDFQKGVNHFYIATGSLNIISLSQSSRYEIENQFNLVKVEQKLQPEQIITMTSQG
jgi:hypothetical protein